MAKGKEETGIVLKEMPEEGRKLENAISIISKQAVGLTIVSFEDRQIGINLLGQVKQYIKSITEERKTATGPLDEAKARIIGWFKPPTEKAESAKSEIENKLRIFAFFPSKGLQDTIMIYMA